MNRKTDNNLQNNAASKDNYNNIKNSAAGKDNYNNIKNSAAGKKIHDDCAPKGTKGAASHKARNAYFLFLLILAFVILLFLMYCRKSLELYELSQPQYVMDAYLEELKATGFTENDLTELEFSEQNPEDLYIEEMNTLLSERELHYQKLRENYSDGALIYGIYAEDTKLAEVSLLPASSYNRMYLLTITDWEVSKLSPVAYQSEYRATITVPADYEVTVNGEALAEEMLLSSEADDTLDYCREYVTIPSLLTYDTGAYSHPLDIEIKNQEGEAVYSTESHDLEVSTDSLLSSSGEEPADTDLTISFGYAQPDMPQELQEMVLENVERYSNFFTKDLDGNLSGVDALRDIFPEDSIYLSLAEQYYKEDSRVVASHTNTHFENEAVTEYTVYSVDCFSCRVSFDKSMTVGGKEVIDTTDNVYYYVRLDGDWVIADIQ